MIAKRLALRPGPLGLHFWIKARLMLPLLPANFLPYKQVIRLRRRGLKHSEIGALLEISEQASRQRLYIARRLINRMFDLIVRHGNSCRKK